MKDWKKTLIAPSKPIMEAMQIIDKSALQIALVIDDDARLVGVVTDGDIRRGILRGVPLDQPISEIMYRNFTSATQKSSRDEIIEMMKKKELHQIPVLDEYGRVIGLKGLVDLIDVPETDNWVVLMAGGIGSRLRPLTDDCPKPLLHLNDKPILEIILENLITYGFKNIYIAVNYKAEMIESHFGDGSKWNVRIDYLREKQAMGTAGALGLLPERPLSPLLVMNADLLTEVNFKQLLDFHSTHKAHATMCVRDYRIQVPFGVVQLDQYRISSIDEKPTHRFFVNAGIYVLMPEVLDKIPQGTTYDMTDLFQNLIAEDGEVIAFPIHEHWLDIGRYEDYQRADAEYSMRQKERL
jgi:dTDP-glucose pyrophosphorylase